MMASFATPNEQLIGSLGVRIHSVGETIKRLLVVDDYEPWRLFLSKALQQKSELQIIGEALDGMEAVRQAHNLQPDLVLLDIGLPALNGIEAARQIRKVSPASKILFISENRFLEVARKALSMGGGGYLVKSDAGRELLPAVDAVLRGKSYFSASVAGHDSSALFDRGEMKDRNEVGFYAKDAS